VERGGAPTRAAPLNPSRCRQRRAALPLERTSPMESPHLTIHIIGIAVLAILVVAVALTVAGSRLLDSRTAAKASPPIVTSAHAERVVVMPTAGGRLEVAAVHVREAFARSDPRLLLDRIDLGTTVSEVRVDATYRYHLGMARAWPLRIVGKTCLVRAGALRPTLPVAFDTAAVERRTHRGRSPR